MNSWQSIFHMKIVNMRECQSACYTDGVASIISSAYLPVNSSFH